MCHEREREKGNKNKKGQRGHIMALFFIHLMSLKISQQDDSNHALKNYQTKT